VIPYLHIPTLHLFGVVPIQPFGLLVATGVLVGYFLARRRAAATGLDVQTFSDAATWIVVGGFILAHVVDIVFYYPERLRQNPLALFAIWEDISSFGGFIGGGLVAWLYFRRRGLPALKYADAFVFGMVPAWIFGRMGCAVVHDHPGRATSLWFGVRFPDGIGRFDLGLYEMVFAVLLTAILYALRRVRPFDGFHTSLMLILYAPVRFALDLLRVEDRTYLGLTPAQYLCVVMALLGAYLMFHGRRAQREVERGVGVTRHAS